MEFNQIIDPSRLFKIDYIDYLFESTPNERFFFAAILKKSQNFSLKFRNYFSNSM